tara:strand:+ start:940 stop:1107 length:168 start_codon:yes stop_codon:yes gene_type:complete
MKSIIGKRGLIWDYLIPALIVLAVLAVVLIAYFAFTGRLEVLVEWARNVFRFRTG